MKSLEETVTGQEIFHSRIRVTPLGAAFACSQVMMSQTGSRWSYVRVVATELFVRNIM